MTDDQLETLIANFLSAYGIDTADADLRCAARGKAELLGCRMPNDDEIDAAAERVRTDPAWNWIYE